MGGTLFQTLHQTKINLLDSALDIVVHPPVMEELDALPTAKELSRAVDGLSLEKHQVWMASH